MKPYYESEGIVIYHGDCREILPTLPKVDLILADPPYSVSVKGATHDRGVAKGNRNFDFFRGDDDWSGMLESVIEAVRLSLHLLSESGSVYVWCGHRQFGSIVSAIEGSGMSTRPVVWVKKCPPPSPPHSGYSAGLELCVYGYRPGRTWNGGAIGPSNVFVYDGYRHGQPGKVGHPTQKPLGMITKQVHLSSTEGDLILDPYMGSGTTLRAAKDLHRKAIGIEIEERYAEIAARRLEQEVLPFGKQSGKENNGKR